MDLSNIVLNEKIPNYRKLCELIGEKVKGGDSKKAQLKKLEQNLRMEKIGNAFYIREVYEQPLKSQDRRITYSEYVQKLILDMLVKGTNNNNKVLSVGKFLETICMVNQNYSFCREYQKELSEALDVEDDSVFEFYLTSYPRLKQALESGLKALRIRSLIYWSSIIMINIYEDEQSVYRVAERNEIEFILNCEKEIFKDMGYSNKRQILLARKYKTFKEKMNVLLHERSNIKFYFEAYDVTFTKYAREEQRELAFLLDEEELQLNQMELNKLISESIFKGAKNKLKRNQEKTKVKFGKAKSSDLERLEKSKMYIEDVSKITKALVGLERNNLKGEVVYIRQKKGSK